MAAARGGGNDNTIKVVARFRPPNKVELGSSTHQQIVSFSSDDTCNLDCVGGGDFTFDRVFDTSSKQADVFDFSIRNTVDDILNGYNGTVFAYGQTGAGKSFTMMGSDIDDADMKGIIPRITEQIFASIMASPGNMEYTVRVSYMEIYMERIRDLLRPANDNLPVHEEKNKGVYVKGLLEIYVSSVQEVYEVMRRGGMARAVAATNMNQESSRSHSIFVITVEQKNVETGSMKSGQLYLVDLAGSEKVGKTGASGQTLEEAKKINKSLSALGMVINSLTDGKSSHVPYRDSKLTRILQESLGGNSRTTLIINCSPSSYNADETVGTLKFGQRAKAIKNKAKVNAELSPAELKILLKKAQAQQTTYENYISGLEGEVKAWRGGETVPQDRWIPALAQDKPAHKRTESRTTRPDRPETPSRLLTDTPRAETPSRADSRFGERSSTPSVILERDERDEFFRRENELQDQLAEKESQLAAAEKILAETREELQFLRDTSGKTREENENMGSELNELKMQMERVRFEAAEGQISIDSLKDANAELTSELDDVKQQLLDARMSAKETNAMLDEKERKKAEKMAQMMAGFDINNDPAENENRLRQAIEHVEDLHAALSNGEALHPDDLADLKTRLIESQELARQADFGMAQLSNGAQSVGRTQRESELEKQLLQVEEEYQQVLEGKLPEHEIDEIKQRLQDSYDSVRDVQAQSVESMKQEVHSSRAEIARLQAEVAHNRAPASNGTSNGQPSSPAARSLQQQMAEFDGMKKSLMRDLQNRCERVVELEISLDETREQYQNVLRASNSRAQQKKMAFLERNLEQLTVVQRQLVEQNAALKKDVAMAERKLVARNDRILSLEQLLGESQEKLTNANHRFETLLARALDAQNMQNADLRENRFESQLAAVKERLDAAKIGQQRVMATSDAGNNGGSFGAAATFFGSKIAKPLRGGGAPDAAGHPTVASLQGQDGGSAGGKRASWWGR